MKRNGYQRQGERIAVPWKKYQTCSKDRSYVYHCVLNKNDIKLIKASTYYIVLFFFREEYATIVVVAILAPAVLVILVKSLSLFIRINRKKNNNSFKPTSEKIGIFLPS